jgi:hypothetical protein
MRRALVPILSLIPWALALACGGSSPAAETPCVAGLAKGGTYTLAFPSRCVTGVTLRVRSGGAFRPSAASDTLVATTGADGAIEVTASAPPPVEAFAITIPGVPGTTILQQGYQSWGYSGVAQIPASVPLAKDGAPSFAVAADGDPVNEVAGVSYGSAAIGGDTADGGADGGVFIAGAVSAAIATTGVAAVGAASGVGADVTILYGALRETLPVGADQLVHTEALHLALASDARTGLAALTTAMGAAMKTAPAPPARPPGGWFSWNEHFAAIDETLVKANADVVAAKLAPVGMPLVEIDDGWELAWGDWQANPSFPSGMGAIASYITGEGLTAGVWMAPFLVDVTSAHAASAAPSDFVLGVDGKPLVHQPAGLTRTFYVLDGTSAASMKVATDAIAALRTAGFRYFKLDYLYAGALLGGHASAGATANQALAAGLLKLRAAAGADAIIDACGAPIVPVLGFADALRVGTDTAISGVDLKWPFVTAAGRSLGTRGYLFPLVWPDADQAQLRAPYTPDEARAGATLAALAGPAYALGDDLTTLDPTRLALATDPALLDIASGAAPATPADPFAAPAPSLVPVSPVLDFSGANPAAPPPATFAATGKSGARYTVAFSWSEPHGVTVTKAP